MANVPCWRLGAAVGARTGAREAIVAYMSSRSDVERRGFSECTDG
jgi:hypothetical protein